MTTTKSVVLLPIGLFSTIKVRKDASFTFLDYVLAAEVGPSNLAHIVTSRVLRAAQIAFPFRLREHLTSSAPINILTREVALKLVFHYH